MVCGVDASRSGQIRSQSTFLMHPVWSRTVSGSVFGRNMQFAKSKWSFYASTYDSLLITMNVILATFVEFVHIALLVESRIGGRFSYRG